MKGRTRFASILLLLVLVLLFARIKQKNKENKKNDFYSSHQIQSARTLVSGRECRMSTCFDHSRCADIGRRGLRVHLYGRADTESASFAKIREIIQNSNFFESNASRACLFMANTWDTFDRDNGSRDFQKPNPSMATLEPLFGGVNHVLFNLYSGKWPDYKELDFSYNQNFGKINEILSKAILIKASQSRESYRRDFDVSLPLFSRSHPTRGPPFVESPLVSPTPDRSIVEHSQRTRRLLVFKGKRYIYGIGSETRNALHYLNNGDDVLVVTTCRHGKKWKDWKDDNCEHDNREYDKHDYQSLMANSTFCLVPRGRRLGSYRFLEALQLGCIPVVLSNSWVLPFEEIIEWKSCVVSADERLLLQIPETLRAFSQHRIARMRHQCLRLYDLFFSSVERIILTSLLIVEQRIQSHVALHLFAETLPHSPSVVALWHLELIPPLTSSTQVTAIIHVKSAEELLDLKRVLQRLEAVKEIRETLVLWSLDSLSAPAFSGHVRVLSTKSKHRFAVESEQILTEGVLQLAPQTLLSEEEIAFGVSVWREFPSRVVGFVGRSHYWSASSRTFQFSTKWTNRYSLVEMDSSLYHKRFHDLPLDQECADLHFLFLVAHVTREGPLKVTQRKKSSSRTFAEWREECECFTRVTQLMSYIPLVSSALRLDPTLFKDNVSVKRKKFKRLE